MGNDRSKEQIRYAALVVLLAIAAGADEIAFQTDRVYYTNSQGADPGPVERGGDGLNFIDLSPDGRFLLCIGHLYKSWGEYYWLFARDRRDNVTLLEYNLFADRDPPQIYSPRWSADCREILFAVENRLHTIPFTGNVVYVSYDVDYELRVPPAKVNPDQYPPVRQFTVGEERLWYCDWAPDGHFVASTREEIWLTDGTTTRSLGEGFNPDVSPDGTTIAFLIDTDEGKELWTMEVDGSNRRFIHRYIQSLHTDGSYIAWSPDSQEIAYFTFEGIWGVTLDGTVRSILFIEGANIQAISWSASQPIPTAIYPATWGQVKLENAGPLEAD